MQTITIDEVIQKGGAPDARYVVLEPNGDIYFCTVAAMAALDEDYWTTFGKHLKQVVDTKPKGTEKMKNYTPAMLDDMAQLQESKDRSMYALGLAAAALSGACTASLVFAVLRFFHYI